MADGRTVIEGDLKTQRRHDTDATKIESLTSNGLPSFNAGKTASPEPKPVRHQATQILHPAELEATKRALIGWVYTFSREKTGEFFTLYEGRNTIGSGPGNDIILVDSAVSDKHCYILHRAKSKYTFIKDNGSTNGTFLNGEDICDEQRRLNDGDEIQIANIRFVIRLVKEAMQPPAAEQE